MNIEGRRVLITGASRGIGAALAESFAGAGARVALVARSEGPLRALAARLGGAAYPTDLADRAAVADLVERVERDGGPIDVLVNNAAMLLTGRVDKLDADAVDQLFRINLLAPFELCRQALPRMLARGGGHIVNVSSMAGSATVPNMAAYASSKAGLSHFTAALRLELRGGPVSTTLVELGPILTEMLADTQRDHLVARAFQRLYRMGLIVDSPPERVAAAVLAAVREGREHVRLPHRAAMFPLLTEAPRRVAELLLTGLSERA